MEQIDAAALYTLSILIDAQTQPAADFLAAGENGFLVQ